MLERTSRFVLEVLPYLLTALIAALVLPQVIYSQAHGPKAAVTSKISYRPDILERLGTQRAEVNLTHASSWGTD
jgi:branched-subunit amino acid transport protein